MEENDGEDEEQNQMKEAIRIEEQYDVVVFGAGEVPNSVLPIRILRNARHIVACDGALADLLDLGFEPEAVIGDGDSISPSLKEKYKHIFHQIDEQDDNDLTKATKFAIANFCLG